MTVNTKQLLSSVVKNPSSSAVDGKLMGVIWECFTAWMTEQLENNIGVKCLDLGEFCVRKDQIGPMAFFNPMFVVNEGFAHRFKLIDRKPKAAALEAVMSGTPVEVDMAKITHMVSDRIGELVLRETVESAIKDVIERLGEVFRDDKVHGIVSVDMLFGKLVCENRCVEFHFFSSEERRRAQARRSKRNSGKSSIHSDMDDTVSMRDDASVISSVISRRRDPPLQRPRRPLRRQGEVVTQRDVLLSHAQQLSQKAAASRRAREENHQEFNKEMETLKEQLMGEMDERAARQEQLRNVALIHQAQAQEKSIRDRRAKQSAPSTYFPFRTDEDVKMHVKLSNQMLKANLDEQLRERALAQSAAQLGRRGGPSETEGGVSLPMGTSSPETRSHVDERPHLALQAAIDEAYNVRTTSRAPLPRSSHPPRRPPTRQRYSTFLSTRAEAEKKVHAFAHEQRKLSEQAEILRREENRRKAADVREYLEQQVRRGFAYKLAGPRPAHQHNLSLPPPPLRR